ncbi:MAG: LEA type 2 family protein [Chitinophagales bacterium]
MALLATALSSCHITAPIYKRTENFDFHRVDQVGFHLGANAIFYNPNKVKFKIEKLTMDIYFDGKKIGTIGDSSQVRIEKRSEFAIPMNIVVNPEVTLPQGLNTLFKVLATLEATVDLRGVVVVKAYGLKFPITVNETQKVDLTKLR